MVLGEVNSDKLKMLLCNCLKMDGVTLKMDLLMQIYAELDKNTLNKYGLINQNSLINIALIYLLYSLKENNTDLSDDFWKNNWIIINNGVEPIALDYMEYLL